jgi:hypothetical protein
MGAHLSQNPRVSGIFGCFRAPREFGTQIAIGTGVTLNGANPGSSKSKREETNMAIQKKSLTGNLNSTKKSAPAKTATPSVPSPSANVTASARIAFSKAPQFVRLSKLAK